MNEAADSDFSPSRVSLAWSGHEPNVPKQVSIILPSCPRLNASRQQLRFLSTKGHEPGSPEAAGFVDRILDRVVRTILGSSVPILAFDIGILDRLEPYSPISRPE